MKKHGPPPIEKQWCPVCETTRFPCPATKGQWVIVEMRTLFMGVGDNQVICHLCRRKWYDSRAVEQSFTHVLVDPTWKTAHRRAQENEKAKEALNIIAKMLAERVIEDMEKERLGDRTTD